MPTATYIALANLTLTGTDAEVSFASIPATYRDLVVIANWPNSGNPASPFVLLRLNGDTGSNYTWVQMYGDGGSGGGQSDASAGSVTSIRVGYLQNSAAMTRINVMDYSATDKHKTVLDRSDQTEATTRTSAFVGRWANTNAVTSLSLTAGTGTFASGSTFALYGIVS
jgi:hypothetical protein